MYSTPPPPKRNTPKEVIGTPLIQFNPGSASHHTYLNNTMAPTPSGPKKNSSSSSRKRTRTIIPTNSNYNSNNYNNNRNNNNNYIRQSQKVISNKVKSLREECEEQIKKMDLDHTYLIDDLLRDKKNEIDNINKEFEEKINEKNNIHEYKKVKILRECKKIEKTVKNQELNRKPVRRPILQSKSSRSRSTRSRRSIRSIRSRRNNIPE